MFVLNLSNKLSMCGYMNIKVKNCTAEIDKVYFLSSDDSEKL